MDKQIFSKHDFSCCKKFSIFLSLFLLSLTGFFTISIANKVKESKYIGQEVESKNTITVSDTGIVYAAPDLVLVNFSVATEAKTVEQSMAENAEKMNGIIDSMKQEGVEDKDLKTTNFSIYPLYEYDRSSSIWPEGKRILAGYEVSQTLEVKIRDLEKVSVFMQNAVDSGANQVGSLQFTVDDQDSFKKDAREEAIGKAKLKAQELAEQLGASLGRIIDFSEGESSPVFRYSTADMEVGMGGGGVPEIEAGENKIEITVSITYEIY